MSDKPEFSIKIYDSSAVAEWNAFVAESKNGTFLFDRGFMEYHSDRFRDMSLIVRDGEGKIVGLLPGNISPDGHIYYSHQGLTYGGLITDNRMTAEHCLKIFYLIREFLAEKEVSEMIYNPVPHIYHSQPAEEDLYAIFRMHGELISRRPTIAIKLADPLPLHRSRRGRVNKALRNSLVVKKSEDLPDFYNIMCDNLARTYNARPVHTLKELIYLKERFDDNIRLYDVCKGDDVLGGMLLFLCGKVLRIQYLHVSPEGKNIGASDLLVKYLLDNFADSFEYIDYGTSNEQGGWFLNNSLIEYKEGFGGRTVAFDSYRIPIYRSPEVSPAEYDNSFAGFTAEWLSGFTDCNYGLNLGEWTNFIGPGSSGNIVRGIIIDGRPSGACAIARITTDGNGIMSGELRGFIADKSLFGKGAGTLILENMEDIARTRNIERLYVRVAESNKRALALLRNRGFREVARSEIILLEKYLK